MESDEVNHCKGCENLSGNEDLHYFGPSLPPHLRTKNNDFSNRKNIIGPEIPAHLIPSVIVQNEESTADEYGPSASLMGACVDKIHKINFTDNLQQKEKTEKSTKREIWMIQLPSDKSVNFGLGPRQFKKKMPNEKELDRSVWTDTPGLQKKYFAKAKEDARRINQKLISEKNEEMEQLVKKLKKRKSEKSLLEIHEKKIKKIEKRRNAEEKTKERRHFDRNIDLQLNKYDENRKKSVLKKAQLLNDRFANGESKFL